jgi:hypothetical protein
MLPCFPLSLPFALIFTLSCFAPITSHVMSTKGHITYQVGCAEGLVACYIPPSIPNMPKTCLEMPRWKKNGAKGRLWEKELQQDSCTALTTTGICNVRALSLSLLKLIFEITQYLVKWTLGSASPPFQVARHFQIVWHICSHFEKLQIFILTRRITFWLESFWWLPNLVIVKVHWHLMSGTLVLSPLTPCWPFST